MRIPFLFLLLLPLAARGGNGTIVAGKPAGPAEEKLDRAGTRELHQTIYELQKKYQPEPQECVALAVGKSKVINWSDVDSLTYIETRYRLTRTAWGKFLIEVNPVFAKAKDFPSPLTNAQIDAKYLEKMRSCLKDLSPRLMYGGEGSGLDPVRLELRATREAAVPEVKIEIGPVGVRSHSRLYVEDIDCLTMLHETLHLLGLADKYAEPTSGFSWDAVNGMYTLQPLGADFHFNCRFVQKSVMQRQDETARNTAPLVTWKVVQCRCAAGVDCQQKARLAAGASCPAGTTPEMGEQQIPEDSAVANVVTAAFFVLPEGPHERTDAPGLAKHSLVTGGEFLHLVMPGCENANPCFYACERNAYRFEDPTPRVDAVPHVNRGCMPLPPSCGKARDQCSDHPYSLYDLLNATSPPPEENDTLLGPAPAPPTSESGTQSRPK